MYALLLLLYICKLLMLNDIDLNNFMMRVIELMLVICLISDNAFITLC